MNLRDPKSRFAATYVVAGLAIIGSAATIQSWPSIPLLVLFAATNAFFEWRAVEVNDRLIASSGAMVTLTAGVVFGVGSAVIGMAIVAAAGTFQRKDFVERRWFQPSVNFGQLVVSAAATAIVFELLLPDPITKDPSSLIRVILVSVLAAVVFAALGSLQVSTIVRLVFGQRDVRPWTGMAQILGSYMLMGTVGGLLGATYLLIAAETFPLLLALFLIAHLAVASYADLREAHESTIRGFIKALEAKDMFTHGHTARVADFARLIGEELGWSATRLELLRWSALLHDVGTLAVPRDLLRSRDQLTSDEDRQVLEATETVERVLSESDFMAPMMERAARVRELFSEAPKDEITEDAQVLAVAKWFDYETSAKSHTEALTQEQALAALKAESPYRYDPEIVAALATALDNQGLSYGAVELKQHLTREDIAKQAMYDR